MTDAVLDDDTLDDLEPRAPRVRLVAVRVQIEAVLDDGDILTPVPVQPFVVNAADWPGWNIDDTLAEVARQVIDPR